MPAPYAALYLAARAEGLAPVAAVSQARYYHEQAQRDAATLAAWMPHEQARRVRLRVEPDCDADAESLCGDMFDDTPRGKAERKAYLQECEGNVWGIISEVRHGGRWRTIASVWGIVGDPEDSGYVPDMRRAGLAALDERNGRKARKLERRATYAGPALA